MKMMEWIEGMVLLAIGLISLVEGLRLISRIDPHAITDVLGPGYYVFSLGMILIVTGIAYILTSYRNIFKMKRNGLNREMEIQKINKAVFYMIVVFLIYIILIDMFGYLGPSFFFFLLEFKLAGVKSWKSNVLLTLVVTGVFYFVFVQYCRIVFPHGVLLP
jgi:amino acid transporter